MSECDKLILLQVSHQDSDLGFHEAHPVRQTAYLVLVHNMFKQMQGTWTEHRSNKACDSAVLTTLSAASLPVHLLATLYNALGHKRQNNAITSYRRRVVQPNPAKATGPPRPDTLLSKDKYIFTQHSRDQEHTSHVNFNRIFYSRSETRKDRNADHLYITQAEK